MAKSLGKNLKVDSNPISKPKIKVYAGIPSTGTRSDAQLYWWRRMEKQYAEEIEFIFPEIYVGRIFHDFARNSYVEQFLASEADVLFFLDSDVVPSERFLELITKHGDEWKLAGAPYPVWMTPPGHSIPQVVFTVYDGKDGGPGLNPCPIPESGTAFVNGIATGCILIKREVLEKMSKPYFEFKYNPENREMTEGEDLGFCRKVNDLGYKFFIDFSMLAHHYKTVSLLDVSNFVESQKNKIIDEADRMVRQIVAKIQLQKMSAPPKVEPPKSRLILP